MAEVTYAVIETGGKQYRVAPGDVLEVERVRAEEVRFRPVLVVTEDAVRATPEELEGASVTARVVEEVRGPKVVGFTYKPKTNQRRRFGHRQRYSVVEITGIEIGRSEEARPAREAPAEEAPVAGAGTGEEPVGTAGQETSE